MQDHEMRCGAFVGYVTTTVWFGSFWLPLHKKPLTSHISRERQVRIPRCVASGWKRWPPFWSWPPEPAAAIRGGEDSG